MSGPVLQVAEYTDPACPWAWGSEPKLRRLREGLGARVRWRRVFGILFDENDDAAPDPDAEAAAYHAHLVEISRHTRAPLPERLAWVARSSWPASLAAKAAERQGPEAADAVLLRLRRTTFVDGEPADTPERVRAAVADIPGLDVEALMRHAASAEVLEAVRADWAETRAPCPQVLAIDEPGPHTGRAKPLGEDPSDGYRYALPTLVFIGPGGRAIVPGWRPYNAYVDAMTKAAPGILSDTDAISTDKTL